MSFKSYAVLSSTIKSRGILPAPPHSGCDHPFFQRLHAVYQQSPTSLARGTGGPMRI